MTTVMVWKITGPPLFLLPVVLLVFLFGVAVLLALWQWELSTIHRDSRLVPVVSSVVATVAVVIHTTVAFFILLAQSGFVD